LEAELGAWLEGALQEERARRAMIQVEELQALIERLQSSANYLQGKASQQLSLAHSWEPPEAKEEAWAWQEEAERLEAEAEGWEAESVQLLRAALTHSPGMREAHQRLAGYFYKRHKKAETEQDLRTAARFEVLLRAHNQGEHDSYLKGSGALSLDTPAPADIDLYRFEQRGRRLSPVFVKGLGSTPLEAIELPAGSYLLKIYGEGHAEVLLPVRIGRGEHWENRGPGGLAPPVLPQKLGPEERYIPAGYWTSEKEPVWCKGFIIRRTQIRNNEYFQFLKELEARGLQDAVADLLPKTKLGMGEPGRLVLKEAPGLPVVGVSLAMVRAFCSWYSACSGKNWRLPTEGEWEKAARGVDGRRYPWGNFLDPSFCCIRDSHKGAPERADVESFHIDESPYGVRGMAGNVREWCASGAIRGGSFRSAPFELLLDARMVPEAGYFADNLGFRLVRSL
jgi:serine/threonine-protein kinase